MNGVVAPYCFVERHHMQQFCRQLQAQLRDHGSLQGQVAPYYER